MARSMNLATKILPARRDAVIAKFKILLGNFNQELRNVPINSKLYFIAKKELPRAKNLGPATKAHGQFLCY